MVFVMKQFLLIILLSHFSTLLLSQTIQPSVVNTTGGSIGDSQMLVEWSLGEMSITTIGNSSHLVTQGFLQPSLENQVGMEDIAIQADILAFPNPVKDYMYLSAKSIDKWQIEIYDVTGKTILNTDFQPKLDLQALKPGLYIVTLFDKKGLPITSFNIIKA